MATESRGGTVGAGEAEADPLARFTPEELDEIERERLKAEGLCCPLCCRREVEASARVVQRDQRAERTARRGFGSLREPAALPRPPVPCAVGCPGWAVFASGRGLEVQRCDECWTDVDDAPSDEVFQGHPVCRAALRAAKLRCKAS